MSVSYEKRQEKWVKKHNLKIGDYVTVLQKYDNETCGTWTSRYIWVPKMNGFVGKSCEVVDVRSDAIELRLAEGSNSYYFPYSILRKEKEMKKFYKERQAEWVTKNDIQIGDKVRILRKAKGGEDGWPNQWNRYMNDEVGTVGRIIDIDGYHGLGVNFEKADCAWYFPYFVLEKVTDPKDKEWEVSYGLKVKTGDPVLVRDGVNRVWQYGLFSHKISDVEIVFPYCVAGVPYRFCVPYEDNEYLVGTEDDYKAPEESAKPKFIFGAKVKATLSDGNEEEGALIGFDEDDADTPFEVAVQDDDEEFGRIRYWAKSVAYIN